MNKLKIDTITAFVSVNEEGHEGIMAFRGNVGMIPMVCADEERALSLIPIANELSEHAGVKYRVVQFSIRTDITEEITAKHESHE